MMKKFGMLSLLLLGISPLLLAQSETESDNKIIRIPEEILAGEGLDKIKQKDTTRRFYQKNVYRGEDLSIYIVAIGSGITNQFNGFPMEEFIFWKNGKALVEPEGQEPFSVYAGDYFIQAKGFKGKWNFLGEGQLHLELSVIASNRPDKVPSPISKALVFDRDLISGVTENESEKSELLYDGVELTVRINRSDEITLTNLEKETMLHLVNGVLTLTPDGRSSEKFFPGDFFVLPKGFSGKWKSASLQGIRALEVTRH